jgi:hypothetical protein
MPDFDLDASDSGADRPRGVVENLLDRLVQEPAGRVVAAHRVAMGAEQLGQRQPGCAWP